MDPSHLRRIPIHAVEFLPHLVDKLGDLSPPSSLYYFALDLIFENSDYYLSYHCSS